MNTALRKLDEPIVLRLALLRNLAESLAVSQSALVRNDAECIARGAAHQAELCRQWSLLEDQIRREAEASRTLSAENRESSSIAGHSQEHEQEFAALTTRIRHLTRVHASLLRHLQRSFAILERVVESCQPTYAPDLTLQRAETSPQGGD